MNKMAQYKYYKKKYKNNPLPYLLVYNAKLNMLGTVQQCNYYLKLSYNIRYRTIKGYTEKLKYSTTEYKPTYDSVFNNGWEIIGGL